MTKIFRIIIISLVSITLVSGCASLNPAFYEKTSFNIDLSKFQKDGLFITSGDFYSKYDPLSILTVTCFEGYIKRGTGERQQTETKRDYDAIYDTPPTFKLKDFDYKKCMISDLLDYLFESAKEIGANGIIKLEIKPVTQKLPNSEQAQNGVLVTGLAVKF